MSSGTLDDLKTQMTGMNDSVDSLKPSIDDLSNDADRKFEDSEIVRSKAEKAKQEIGGTFNQAQSLLDDLDAAEDEINFKKDTLDDLKNNLPDNIGAVSDFLITQQRKIFLTVKCVSIHYYAYDLLSF